MKDKKKVPIWNPVKKKIYNKNQFNKMVKKIELDYIKNLIIIYKLLFIKT